MQLTLSQLILIIGLAVLAGFAIGTVLEESRTRTEAIEAGVAGYNLTNASFYYFKAK